MRVEKKKIVIFLITLIVIIAGTTGFYQLKNKGTSPTNQWIVSRIKVDVANSLINFNKENNITKLQSKYQNTDIKGVISIENEPDFNYPVAQTSDNEYYLNHTYEGKIDSLGAIYADYRINLDTSKKALIFGHSSTKRDVPFNKLENYYEEEYYKNHKYITLETETNTYRYEIFSVYVETIDFTYMNIKFDTTNDWYNHLLKLQKKSLYKTNINLSNDDNILILQTCSNNQKYQNYSQKYLLIVSRRVK